ncbi:WD40 repeat domain-containing protein, partial [Frankia tisae]|uniref:WD40 repeat domain-containing protein n=1 Tax=Frankia tisae TaxID=2950104 RepID=UPI0035591001
MREIVFSPDGRLVAYTAGTTLVLADTHIGTLLRTLTGHTGLITSVAFSLDGTHLATASDDHTARIWNTTDGTCTHTLTGHTARVSSADFSPAGHVLATVGNDDTCRLWDVATGDPIATMIGLRDGGWG